MDLGSASAVAFRRIRTRILGWGLALLAVGSAPLLPESQDPVPVVAASAAALDTAPVPTPDTAEEPDRTAGRSAPSPQVASAHADVPARISSARPTLDRAGVPGDAAVPIRLRPADAHRPRGPPRSRS